MPRDNESYLRLRSVSDGGQCLPLPEADKVEFLHEGVVRRVAREEYFRYLPVSPRDRGWDLYVTGAGRIVHAMPGTPDPGHPSPYYYVWENGRELPYFGALYVTQGEGEFDSKFTGSRTITAGTVVLTFPGVWHRYRPLPNTHWTYYWVHFAGGYPERLMQRGFFSPRSPVLRTGVSELLLQSYVAMLDRARSEPPGYQQLMAANVMEILGVAMAASRGQPQPERLNALARQATLLLQQRVEELIDMKQLACSLHISYDRFRHVFKQHTGMAPYQYHLQLRINRAKELLNGTRMSVKEIAARLQFDDTYHFSRIFKKKTGMSPSQWRGETK